MYNIKVQDLVDIKEVKTSFDINDLIHICKRCNNTKREYLFVNKYQGKHIPQAPNKITGLFDELVLEIKKNVNPKERIVVVGFAETATGIAEYVTYSLSMDKTFCNTIVYHLQTTRENYPNKNQLISFDEEHSHAVNQFLYSDKILPAYDRVLFIEDEITTGNTILNFISEFKKINPDCKYSVASILNWQTEENIKKFKDNNVERIYLISGYIKKNIPEFKNFKKVESNNYLNIESENVPEIIQFSRNVIPNSRLGVNGDSFKYRVEHICSEMTMHAFELVKPNDKIMVIGTEEFMFYPLMLAKDIGTIFGNPVSFRATTRSPITCNNDSGYIITDSITLPSAYNKDRVTYLYNLKGNYNKIIVFSDVNMTEDFRKSLAKFAEENKKEIIFIKISG